ncbi:hypothetical protein NDU88_005520 [Pleurodeles waltl]|uniref:Uncharacterized protein n=1 Tax=Pleurodeles waltl TaxID=8319 RepID=A0AAV7PFM3_PLEWA|nr:hypothetical protein NDU88_005520 [Pleurodeles waltl]
MLSTLFRSETQSTPVVWVLDMRGREMHSQQDLTELFATHLQGVYAAPDGSTQMAGESYMKGLKMARLPREGRVRLDGPLTKEKIVVAIRVLKPAKAPVEDGLPASLYQRRGGSFTDLLQ